MLKLPERDTAARIATTRRARRAIAIFFGLHG
jgi:hypothetical protein